ncbi:hypothetical protein GJ496_010132 [Pomphorhynchus laevis]|nr:hypothetical protein GJ496_010132 [Pomphorhynchus laevis]
MIFTPTNQIKLTNVAIVRLKKSGKRFEVACYKNKVVEYREGIEKDINNVIQSSTVFSNVSKGQAAKKEDLRDAFGTDDQDTICLDIIKKGELQVSEKERQEQHGNLFKEIAQLISDKCIEPSTQKQYPISIIEKAMKQLHYNANPRKNAKAQSLDVIKLLQQNEILPIQKAKMKLRITLPGTGDAKSCRQRVVEMLDDVLVDEFKNKRIEIIGCADPGVYKLMQEYLQAHTKGKGHVEILSLKDITATDDEVS